MKSRLKKQMNFWEKTFLKYMDKCDKGKLILLYPQNESYELGTNEANTAQITINNFDFFKKTILFGGVGFSESYVDGDWDTPDLVKVLDWFVANINSVPTFSYSAKIAKQAFANLLGLRNRFKHWQRKNTLRTSQKNIADHYDLSNAFFEMMLDPTLAYSCALFSSEEDTLEQAQLHKFGVICRKLQLEKEDHLLEIGSGWGSLAIYAAENYGCKVTTTTISKEQYEYTKERIEKHELQDKIQILQKDYRDLNGSYDKIVSIEMIEALGFEYFDAFFSQCNKLLKSNGLMLLQCITYPDPYYHNYLKNVDWTQIYIFPGSALLSLTEILKSLNRTGNIMVWDVQSFGDDYARTLDLWKKNVIKNKSKIEQLGFDEHFFRKWLYYLDFCHVGFKNHHINDIQIVLSRPLNAKFKNSYRFKACLEESKSFF